MADVFLSYKREDQQIAREVAADLEAEGFSVFFDVRIDVGDSWDERIERELNAAKACVVLWSPKSRDSKWVRREAREAMARGILSPALIARCKVPIEFSDVQAANLIGRRAGDRPHLEWRRLCDGVERHVGPKTRGAAARPTLENSPTVTQPTETLDQAQPPRINRLAVAAAIAAAIIIGFIALNPWERSTSSGQPTIDNSTLGTSLAEQSATESASESPTTRQADEQRLQSAGAELRNVLGTWRCASGEDHFPQLIRFTSQGRDIVRWYTSDGHPWADNRTDYIYVVPHERGVWQDGVNGSEWTMRNGRIEIVRDNVYGSIPGCTAFERLS